MNRLGKQTVLRFWLVLAILTVCWLLLVLVEAAQGRDKIMLKPVGEVIQVEYLRTIDGDTIEVVLADRIVSVRFFAVDAPELETGTADAFFVAAAVATLLEGSTGVWLEFDPEHREDRWQRSLAWVWYEYTDTPGEFGLLNLEMLHDEGFGVKYYPACQSHFYDEWLPVD